MNTETFFRKFKSKFFSKEAPCWLAYYFLVKTGLDRSVSDKNWLKLRYRCELGRRLNLKNPQTFTEKLQWLKLYDRNPLYTTLVDKVAVKDWVAEKIGQEYIIPTLATYNSVDDIEWDLLPNQFVIKWNHDSHSIVICRDKSQLDIELAKAKLARGARENGFWHAREWPYKNVKPRLIVEKYMEEPKKPNLTDYKFFCFDGNPRIMYLSSDMSENAHTDFFDMDYNHLPVRMKDPNSDVLPPKPEKFEELKALARKLCEGFPHVRTDFYLINDSIYFGELTFYHNAGLCEVNPPEWSRKLGDWISVPAENGGGYLLIINDLCLYLRCGGNQRGSGLVDYKFFCFDGEPKAMFVASGRQDHEEPFFDFYDMDFNHLDLRCPHPQSDVAIERPDTFEEMKNIARQLSKRIPHVRVDLYEINGRTYFGEMTLYHWEGLMPFYPEEWNLKFGQWIMLPNK